ncbi:unnamed protein product [Cylicocyclus nassatus]|uniref:Sphingomyelin synthase-like domain-containing protein n=1 Tax=Cylicocyclus nassatus TaxID=53992 RepID=A0AA36GZB2_CYLNA|nr:unnamed protein product [Cylicocyclus nassatus]
MTPEPIDPFKDIWIKPVMDDEPTSSSRRGVKTSASRRMCGSTDSSTASDSDTADDAPLLHGSGGGGGGGGVGGGGGGVSGDDGTMSQTVRIEMPPGEKPASPHDRFPKDRTKAVLSFLLLAFAAVLNEVVLSFVHERVPETPPLPDITFSLVPYYQEGLKICEYIMLASFSSVLLLMLFHRHRWIMFRRLMMVGSLLYLMRCVTMIVTQVPVADPNFLCSPKFGENGTFWDIVLRGLKSVAGVGLNVQGKDTLCGDYIYSGHTIVLVVSALFMGEYSPRRWRILHAFYWLVALVGVIFLSILGLPYDGCTSHNTTINPEPPPKRVLVPTIPIYGRQCIQTSTTTIRLSIANNGAGDARATASPQSSASAFSASVESSINRNFMTATAHYNTTAKNI